jgi:hypothetical protein
MISAWKQPAGERFPADFYFAGENKNTRAALCYWHTPEVKEKGAKDKQDKEKGEKGEKEKGDKEKVDKEKKGKDDKVTIYILSLAGDTLRTLKHEPDTGFNAVNWNFETKGIRFPSKEEPKKDSEEEGNGPSVMPGTYKIIYSWNDIKDSSTVNIGIQPGLEVSAKNHDQYVRLWKDAAALAQSAEKAYADIRAAEKSIALVKDALTYADDSTKKKVNERIDSLQKKIDVIKETFFGKENTKGIQDDSHTLINQLYTMMYSLSEYENGTNSANIIANCKQNTDKAIALVNSCMTNEFDAFKKLVAVTQFNYFKKE